MKKAFVIILSILILSSCTTNSSLTTSRYVDKKKIEDSVVQVSNFSNIEVKTLGLDSDGNFNRVLFMITNNSDHDYSFIDNKINIYGGNAEKDSWKFIQFWNASEFINRYHYDATSDLKFLNFASSVSFVYSLFDDDVSPLDVLITSAITKNAIKSNEISSKLKAESLNGTLLKSQVIKSGESYSGIILFPRDRKYSDYKIVLNPNRVFIFERSDREEILHPWTGEITRTVNSFTLSTSLNRRTLNLTYSLFPPKGIGIYTGFGFTLPNDIKTDGSISKNQLSIGKNKYTEYELSNNKYFAEGTSCFGGITFKADKNFYISLGLSSTLIEKLIVKSDIKVNNTKYEGQYILLKDKESTIGCQGGFTYVLNFLSFSALYNYDFTLKQHSFDLGVGVAF